MRLAAWNLNHRSRLKKIPDGAIAAIRKVQPEALVLTEYVDDDDSRVDFRRQLSEAGLVYCSVSDRRSGHNQVLIASTKAHARNSAKHPGDSHAGTNFLAVYFQAENFTLIGVRAPAYKSSREANGYWQDLTALLEARVNEKVVLIGDLNADPEIPRFAGGKSLQHLRSAGWKIPSPEGEWSYISPKGTGARIDHIVASPAIRSVSALYESDVAKPNSERAAISDHAILVCEIAI